MNDDALRVAYEQGRFALCTVDEAELVAIGAPAAGRAGRSVEADTSPAALRAAGERLVERGLAQAGAAGLSPLGPLAVWWSGFTHSRGALLTTRRFAPAVPDVHRRFGLLTGEAGCWMTVVEETSVPQAVDERPLPVQLDAVRPDRALARIHADLFADREPGTQVTLDVVSTLPEGPMRLVADDDGVALLTGGPGLSRSTPIARATDQVGVARLLADLIRRLNARAHDSDPETGGLS